MLLQGVDGCAAGWLCATLDLVTGHVSADTFSSAHALLVDGPRALVTAIDIPIGLPTAGSRSCDVEARRLLGPRGSSVFPAPVRATLLASTYEEACLASRAACGKGLSKQTHAILQKIGEVDTAIRHCPGRACEVHPELSFYFWNNRRPMAHPKTSGFGFLERYRLVREAFGNAADAIRQAFSHKAVCDDDILDALAALWTAKRIHSGMAVAVPAVEQCDDNGFPMRILA